MISEAKVLESFKGFANNAMPFLLIKDDESYDAALHFLEVLFEQVGDDESKPEQYLISLISNAISSYEDKQNDVIEFIKLASEGQNDVAVLRTLIDQHDLKLDDFPEIGDKTLLSKILSGKRQLTKSHIKLLSKRFDIEPGMFF